MKKSVFILLTFFALFQVKAQYFTVSGFVADSSLAPVANVSIYITNGSVVGVTDATGFYSFELRSGSYELVFTHSEFQQTKIKVLLSQKNDTVNIILRSLVHEIGEARISKKYHDPGPDMMQRAIDKREYWASRFPSYSCNIYIRAFEEFHKAKKRENPWHTGDTAKERRKKKEKDEEVSGNMAEISLTRNWMPPKYNKEIRNGVSLRGDISGLFYTTTTDGDFNFYTNLIKIPALSEMPVVSPLSNIALSAYKFKFLGSYKDPEGRRILKIKMEPRLISNSTFSGEIHLVDTLYYIYRLELHFPKNQLNEYSDFTVLQEYTLTKDSFLTITNERFDYYAKAGKGKFSGYTLVSFENYELNKRFPKGFFGMEISATEKEAYERDSSFWNKRRTTPLNATEIRFINKDDSIKRVLNSKEYLDSMEKDANKVTLVKLLFKGQQYQKRAKGLEMDFQPLMFIAQPWYPGGTRIVLWNTINKTTKNKREFNFSENISYGINNEDYQGSISFTTLYNPFKRAQINVSVGRQFNFINQRAALLDVVRRDNFYQYSFVSAFHRIEIINGLYFRTYGEISDRKDISGMAFSSFGDEIYANNDPSVFTSHRAFFAEGTLSYTPFQKYIREPKQKIILGSRWPTISINYRKAIPGVFNSNIDYDFLEYRIEGEIPVGLLGRSEFRAVSGSFLNKRVISPIDYRYQRRGDLWIFTPPMYAFQTLDSTFLTFKRFYEAHYRHHFNGAIVNKIPGFKVLQLRESIGANILYAPERRNMLFYEVYFGADKLIRIWRERFKIGLYYTVGYSNIFDTPRYGFKINFEYYNRRNNTW